MALDATLKALLGEAKSAPATDTKSEERVAARKPSEISCEELIEVLRSHQWRLRAAARHLGISKTSLYGAIDRCPQIRKAGDLSDEELRTSFRECGGDLDLMVERLEVSKRGIQLRLKALDPGI